MKKGDVYRHYKGGIYSYFGIVIPKAENHVHATVAGHTIDAIHEPTAKELQLYRARFTRAYIADIEEPCVLYESIKSGQLWARPIEDFCGWVMEDDYPSIQRFKLVESK